MRESRHGSRIPAVVLVLLLGLAPPLAAQTGSVSGRITDGSTQAPLSGVLVELLADGASAASALTGQDGRFLLAGITPGTYSLTVTMIGYEPRDTSVSVQAGAVTTLDLALRSAALALDAMVVTASRRAERAQEAPASVAVVPGQQIRNRAAVASADHVRTAPGVDVAQTGIHQANVVVRGFNAAFTNSLAYLVDYRISSVPGLHVNRFGNLPLTGEDIDRIEVVLGPGAALYGPNTANGVLHVLSRSALTETGTVASVSGGERDAFMGTFRTAHRVRDNLGVKLSGQYFRGIEWPFTDTAEARLQVEAQSALDAFRSAQLEAGRTEQQIADSIARDPALLNLTRIGVRPETASRHSVDGRIDWAPAPGLNAAFQFGRSHNNSVDLTGIGASYQDFRTEYYQGRLSYGRLFGQLYLSRNDAGDTYGLRSGEIAVDNSSQWVGQLQHGVTVWDDRQNFIYGLDVIHTIPRSGGTIYGRNEGSAETTQTGVYLQSETRLRPNLNLVAAGRFDRHSVVDDDVFSPRLGLVYTPFGNHTLRATFNRAFKAPTAINLFLDRLSSRSGPFAVRAIAPGAQGFDFRLDDGSLAFRSPWSPAGPDARLAYSRAAVSQLAIGFLGGALFPEGIRLTPAEIAQMLEADPAFAVIGLNPQTRHAAVFDPDAFRNLDGIKPELSQVFEVGYRGLLGGRYLLTADLWRLRRENFISELYAPAPMLLVSAPQVREFLVANGIAEARANALSGAVESIPMGVVAAAENDIYTGEVPILISYQNYAKVDMTGLDLGAQALLGDWHVAATASLLSDDYFTFGADEQPIALNSPKYKGSVSVGYDNPATGITGEVRGRYASEYPVYTGVYVGNSCVEGDQGLGDCVKASTLFDLSLGYRLPWIPGASVHLNVSNVLDTRHQPFVGVPEIGRLAVLRLRHEF